MGAQTVSAIEELIFTESDESILVTLADGRSLELFGDGYVQIKVGAGVIQEFDTLVAA